MSAGETELADATTVVSPSASSSTSGLGVVESAPTVEADDGSSLDGSAGDAGCERGVAAPDVGRDLIPTADDVAR